MENAQKLFCFDYKNIIVDEIALSGLDGVGFNLLWKLVEKRISNLVTKKMKERYWKFIIDCDAISLYINPVPLPVLELKDRCSIIHPTSGLVTDPPDYLDGPYEFCPIEGEHGSCAHYITRTLLKKENIQCISYEKIATEYYDTLVMVASIEERCHALAPHMPIQFILNLNAVQYCMLELIGRARENGQSSTGKSNILLIDNDPKLLFYNRKILHNLNIIDVRNFTQWIGTKSLKSLIMRLRRFHTTIFHDYPTHGIINDLCKYLLDKEDLCESTDILLEKNLLHTKVFRKLNKTVSSYLFSSEYKTVLDESSKARGPIKKKFMRLNIPSDNSSSSEDEGTEGSESLKCQYKVKVNLLRQAYELILEAGLKGLTLNELSILLGTDFYVSRSILRTFTQNKLVRDFVDDKGKQNQYKYVAMTATEDINSKYSDEVKTLKQYFNDNKIAENDGKDLSEIPSTSKITYDNEEVPAKRIKLEENDEINNFDNHNIEDHTTELTVLEGFENQNFESLLAGLSAKKLPSVRQLQYANMILKIVNENKVICGLYTLAAMVVRALNQTCVDYKGIKSLIQRLLIDKQIKIYQMKSPVHQNKCQVFVCAPHIKVTDAIVKSKFRELVTKTMVTVKPKIKRPMASTPLIHCTFPRYMRIQKLHEIIAKTVYFSEDPPEGNLGALPHGYSSLVKLIPEFTVEFAIGNISMSSGVELNRDSIPIDLHPRKLRDVPQNVLEALLNSDSLQMSIKENLKALASMGLIQMIKDQSLGHKQSKMIMAYIFYVNRYPKILDTTGKWPRNTYDKINLEKSYFFETFKDVQQYWTDVYNIATNTKIEGKRDRKNLVTPIIRLQNEVYENDNGQIYGDGRGPCGFDSSIRMDVKKSWSNLHNNFKENRKNVLPNLQLSKTKISSRKKKIVKKKKKPEFTTVTKVPTTAGAVRKRKVVEAPKNWTAEEDKILMFCKAAISIISPVSQPGCLIIRNLIAKDILSMYDPKKDACNCHKRCAFLESNKSLGYLNESIINELKFRNLLTKYDGLLKKLRLQYTKNMRKVISEAKVSMLELIWLILQIERSKSFMRQIPCVALNHEEFHENFTITKSGDGSKNYYRLLDNFNDEISIAKEAIVMTVMASYNDVVSIENAKRIYSLLSSYPEQQLRTSLHQLRKAGAVAAKEKLVNSQYNQYQFRDLTQSAYKISVPYTRKWICRLNSEFIDDVLKNLNGLPEGNLKASPGVNCLLLEQHACNLLDIITTTTPNILDPAGNPIPENRLHDMDDVKLSFKSGSCSWKNKSRAKNFAEHYQDIKFESALEELVKNCSVTVVESAKEKEEKKIIPYLKTKAQLGTSFKELLQATGYDTKTLMKKLLNLESKSIIKRVGINENVIILTEFSNSWTAHIKTQAIIPVPWLTPDLTMRYSIFLKWLAVVANKVVENPGSSLTSLADSCETITARAVQDICMFLQKTECVTMKVITIHEPSLFSDDDEQINELTEFNEYESVHNILVFPLKNTFTKYVSLVKRIKDKYNIIDKYQTPICP